MIQAYLSTMADLGAETWLMHGTLMGWWWNGKVWLLRSCSSSDLILLQILPWDSDIDVQVTLETMQFLFNYYQLYVFHYDLPEFPEGRDYMLEINPGFAHMDRWDYLNGIDARWIDMQTGIFIDMTAIHVNETAKAIGARDDLICKDKHKYNVRRRLSSIFIGHHANCQVQSTDIFPLRDSFFEGIPAKVPFEYTWVLEEEYTKASLTRTEWER